MTTEQKKLVEQLVPVIADDDRLSLEFRAALCGHLTVYLTVAGPWRALRPVATNPNQEQRDAG